MHTHEVYRWPSDGKTWRIEFDCQWCDAHLTTAWGKGNEPIDEAKAHGWGKVNTGKKATWERHQCGACIAAGRRERLDGKSWAVHRMQRRWLRQKWHEQTDAERQAWQAAGRGESPSGTAAGKRLRVAQPAEGDAAEAPRYVI